MRHSPISLNLGKDRSTLSAGQFHELTLHSKEDSILAGGNATFSREPGCSVTSVC